MSDLNKNLSSLGEKIKNIRESSTANKKTNMLAVKTYDTLKNNLLGKEELLESAEKEQIDIYQDVLRQTIEYATSPEPDSEKYQKSMLDALSRVSSLNDDNKEVKEFLRDLVKSQASIEPIAKKDPNQTSLLDKGLFAATSAFFNPIILSAANSLADSVIENIKPLSAASKNTTADKIKKAETQGEIGRIKEDLIEAYAKEDPEDEEDNSKSKKKKKKPIDRKSDNSSNLSSNNSTTENNSVSNSSNLSSNSSTLEKVSHSDDHLYQTFNEHDYPKEVAKEIPNSISGEREKQSNAKITKTVKIDKLEIANLIIKKMTMPNSRKFTDRNKQTRPTNNTPTNASKIMSNPLANSIARDSGLIKASDVSPSTPEASSGLIDLDVFGVGGKNSSKPKTGTSKPTNNKIGSMKNFLTSAKGIAGIGTLATLGLEGYQTYNEYQEAKDMEASGADKMKVEEAKSKAIGGGIGGVGGALGGAAIGAKAGALSGAALGSVVPIVGTAAGGLVGGAVGGVLGSIVGATSGRKVGGNIGAGLSNGTIDPSSTTFDEMGNPISSSTISLESTIQRSKESQTSKIENIKNNSEIVKEKMDSVVNNNTTINNNNGTGENRNINDNPVTPASSRTSDSSFRRWQDNNFFG